VPWKVQAGSAPAPDAAIRPAKQFAQIKISSKTAAAAARALKAAKTMAKRGT